MLVLVPVHHNVCSSHASVLYTCPSCNVEQLHIRVGLVRTMGHAYASAVLAIHDIGSHTCMQTVYQSAFWN